MVAVPDVALHDFVQGMAAEFLERHATCPFIIDASFAGVLQLEPEKRKAKLENDSREIRWAWLGEMRRRPEPDLPEVFQLRITVYEQLLQLLLEKAARDHAEGEMRKIYEYTPSLVALITQLDISHRGGQAREASAPSQTALFENYLQEFVTKGKVFPAVTSRHAPAQVGEHHSLVIPSSSPEKFTEDIQYFASLVSDRAGANGRMQRSLGREVTPPWLSQLFSDLQLSGGVHFFATEPSTTPLSTEDMALFLEYQRVLVRRAFGEAVKLTQVVQPATARKLWWRNRSLEVKNVKHTLEMYAYLYGQTKQFLNPKDPMAFFHEKFTDGALERLRKMCDFYAVSPGVFNHVIDSVLETATAHWMEKGKVGALYLDTQRVTSLFVHQESAQETG